MEQPMSEFLKMDIFFVATTAVVVLFGIAGLVALFYVIKILRSVEHVAENVSEESDNIREDVSVLRKKAHEEGVKMKHLADFVGSITRRAQKRASEKKKQ